MLPDIRDSGPALTEELIAGTEEVLEVRLPPEYRSFLLRHNGGRPTPNRFAMSTYGDFEVEDFYRLEHPHNNIVARAEALWDRDIVPRGLLPVALLRGGRAYLFLAVAGIERDSGAGDLVGTVYGWLPDNPAQGTTVWHDLIHVADNFEHFLQLIAEVEPKSAEPAAPESAPSEPAAPESAPIESGDDRSEPDSGA